VSAKPVVRLQAARQDELDTVAYYAREAGLDVALRLTEELKEAYRKIADHPGTGSPRYAELLGIEALRSRKLGRFPYLVFYIEHGDRIEVWRVLHAQRDIPAWLAEADGT
jgi:toxin ParE1/3/4